MTYVVTENCTHCRFTDCLAVCPVECFHADDTMLYIDPAVCIDCGACVPECPVGSIFSEEDLPDNQHAWMAINAERAPRLPVVTEQQPQLPTAEAKKAALGF